QSSHGRSASMSSRSTVAPPQIRSPAGASRYPAMSYATPSFSSRETIFLTAAARSSPPSASNHGSTILRQIDVHERTFGSEARNANVFDWPIQAAIAARLDSERAIRPLMPPIFSAHASESSASSTHSIDGVLMVEPWKISSSSFPFFVMRKIFGIGHGGV